LEVIGIITISPWYALQAQKMLWEKRNIYSYKYDKKMRLTKAGWQSDPHKKLESEDQTTKDSKYSTHPQDVVEMRYHIISIM